jgi:hypothetical protein
MPAKQNKSTSQRKALSQLERDRLFPRLGANVFLTPPGFTPPTSKDLDKCWKQTRQRMNAGRF